MSTVETLSPADQQYYCRLTDAGAALEAAAHAEARPVRLTHVAVGDGGGIVPVPEASATALVNEVYRREIDGRNRDEEDPNIAWLHIIIPADVGGFWIREFGIYAEPLTEGGEPVLYAYGNHAPYYKLLKVNGQASTHELSIPIILTGTAEVEIAVKEVGYASQLALENLEKRLWENDGQGSLLLSSILPEGVLTTSRLLPGGGLALDADGKVFVDVDSMNEQRFETLLKALRVPLWLTQNTDFYVNGATGSDTLDAGRGLTADKPFKTIQACVNYVCDNYNLGKWDATIHIAPGTYPESVTLGSYSSTTGVLYLAGHDTGTGELDTVIATTNNKCVNAIAAKSYRVRNIKFDYAVNSSTKKYEYCIGAIDGAALYLDRFHINATYAAGLDSSTFNRLIYSSNRGLVFLQNTSAGSSKITINNGGAWLEGVIRVENNGTFQMGGAVAASSQYIICSGVFNRFIIVDASAALRYAIYTYNLAFSSTNVSGIRYQLVNGGHCSMGGGPDFFPGTEAGIADAATNCWYK